MARRERRTDMDEGGFSRELELVNPHGLHLRPASKFVAVANRYVSDIFVSVNGGVEGNAKSILDLTAHAAEKGSRIQIRAVGEDAREALAALVRLVESGFDEVN